MTIAMGELEARGLIRGDRGVVHILDRKTLIKLTDGSYGLYNKSGEYGFLA